MRGMVNVYAADGSPGASMPYPHMVYDRSHQHCAVIVDDNVLFVAGGEGYAGDHSEFYNKETDQWTVAHPMPNRRMNPACGIAKKAGAARAEAVVAGGWEPSMGLVGWCYQNRGNIP